MIPVRGYRGANVAVLGLGRSGQSAVRALTEGGANVLAWDDDAAQRASIDPAQICDLTKAAVWDDVATLIVSPGIAHLYPNPHAIVAAAVARGVAIDNDVGLFFASLGGEDWDKFLTTPRTVAVTGSNGKSTTSALIHHILTALDRPAQLGGNIGVGLLDLEPPVEGDVIVAELSSYQTELARALTPDIAVFTNLSPDHLDRHAGMGGYFAAKRRLFAEGGPDRAIIGVDEPEGRFLANQLATNAADDRVIRISASAKIDGPGWSVTARKGFLAERRKGRQIASIDLRAIAALPGAHNHQNACAAYAVARALGLAPRDIETALKTFAGLPHRSQRIADINGVVFVNDSKATNVEAAARSLSAFQNVHWIAGGEPKAGGYAALSKVLGGVKAAYLIGAAANEIAAHLGDTPVTQSGTLDGAVLAAAKAAQPGDTVLLAPACASFDQFKDFEARGQVFIDAVKALETG